MGWRLSPAPVRCSTFVKETDFSWQTEGVEFGVIRFGSNSNEGMYVLGAAPRARPRGTRNLNRIESRFFGPRSFRTARRASNFCALCVCVAHDEFVRSEPADRCCDQHRRVIGTGDSVSRQPSGLHWARATREMFRLQRRCNNNCSVTADKVLAAAMHADTAHGGTI